MKRLLPFLFLILLSSCRQKAQPVTPVKQTAGQLIEGKWKLDSVSEHRQIVYRFSREDFALQKVDLQGFIFDPDNRVRSMEYSAARRLEKPLGTYEISGRILYLDNPDENATLDYTFYLEKNQLSLSLDGTTMFFSRLTDDFPEKLPAQE